MGWFNKEEKQIFPWSSLNSVEEWNKLKEDKSGISHVVFKHSTRCGVSSMAKKQFENGWEETENVELWYLDLLNHRDISKQIAEDTQVIHQSPQVVVMKNGTLIHDASHHLIDAREIRKIAKG
jgi:bacillithiol system protein YtxJ